MNGKAQLHEESLLNQLKPLIGYATEWRARNSPRRYQKQPMAASAFVGTAGFVLTRRDRNPTTQISKLS